MVRHRVIPNLGGGDGANAPARVAVRAEQSVRRALGVFLRSDSRVKTLAGIRGADLALALFAVQGDGIGGNLFAPKGRFEARAKIFRRAAQLDSAGALAQG